MPNILERLDRLETQQVKNLESLGDLYTRILVISDIQKEIIELQDAMVKELKGDGE